MGFVGLTSRVFQLRSVNEPPTLVYSRDTNTRDVTPRGGSERGRPGHVPCVPWTVYGWYYTHPE